MPKGMTKKQMGGVLQSRNRGMRGKSKESASLNQKYKNLTNGKLCDKQTITDLLEIYSINSENPGINNKIIKYIINCLINNDYSADLLNAISERIVSTEGKVFNTDSPVYDNNAIYASVRRNSHITKDKLINKLQSMIHPLSGVKNNALSSSHSSLRHTPLSSRRSSQSTQYASIGGARKYRSKKAKKTKKTKNFKSYKTKKRNMYKK